ncbi:MAG: type I secretion system permease/ATPase, partial [Hyphomicrobiaceae bacterium]
MNKQMTALSTAMQAGRGALLVTALFSFVINMLMLAGPLYMLQVYDRVLPSGNIDTLLALSIFLAGLFVVLGLLELVRSRLLSRIGARFEFEAAPALYSAILRSRLTRETQGSGRDITELTSLRDFISSNSLITLFDLPWLPVYLGILFLLHPWLAVLALFGAILLFVFAFANARATTELVAEAAGIQRLGERLSTSNQRNVEAITAMGMSSRMRDRWWRVHTRAFISRSEATDRSAAYTALSKTFRLALQSAALGIAAALVIRNEMTAGGMIAGTIILGRALAPVDQAISHWRGFVAARGSYGRISRLLRANPEPIERLNHGAAHEQFEVKQLYAGPPQLKFPVLQGIRFTLSAGDALAVIGPSASGKSTLARALTGVWPLRSGSVRLDGVPMNQWNGDELGDQIGYLPQDVELFDGTIAENISRFRPNAPSDLIVAAANAADVHDLVLSLADGYETEIGEGGCRLSAGQCQRIGLARAIYGNPFLVVLDEPNASLDYAGELALTSAVRGVRQAGGIVIIAAHRPSALVATNLVLVLEEGRQRAFGPRDDVLA